MRSAPRGRRTTVTARISWAETVTFPPHAMKAAVARVGWWLFESAGGSVEMSDLTFNEPIQQIADRVRVNDLIEACAKASSSVLY